MPALFLRKLPSGVGAPHVFDLGVSDPTARGARIPDGVRVTVTAPFEAGGDDVRRRAIALLRDAITSLQQAHG